jgi:hypothetical protein
VSCVGSFLSIENLKEKKTSPFLIRTFLKIGGFHRLSLFEDGALPTTDEQQIFSWCVVPLLTQQRFSSDL